MPPARTRVRLLVAVLLSAAFASACAPLAPQLELHGAVPSPADGEAFGTTDAGVRALVVGARAPGDREERGRRSDRDPSASQHFFASQPLAPSNQPPVVS